jgi:RimJ/RimL family protein N-acetyltransferase
VEATIEIRKAAPSELNDLYELVTNNSEWTRFNGPYFPYSHPTFEQFRTELFNKLLLGESIKLITLNGVPVGSVSYYWECESTRWLEVGVIIYDQAHWGKGIARPALRLWISELFDRFDIARVGLTTWSGNPRMMKCAENLGMTQEARLRKVRYFNGHYYDSVKYGVLHEEWKKLMAQDYA